MCSQQQLDSARAQLVSARIEAKHNATLTVLAQNQLLQLQQFLLQLEADHQRQLALLRSDLLQEQAKRAGTEQQLVQAQSMLSKLQTESKELRLTAERGKELSFQLSQGFQIQKGDQTGQFSFSDQVVFRTGTTAYKIKQRNKHNLLSRQLDKANRLLKQKQSRIKCLNNKLKQAAPKKASFPRSPKTIHDLQCEQDVSLKEYLCRIMSLRNREAPNSQKSNQKRIAQLQSSVREYQNYVRLLLAKISQLELLARGGRGLINNPYYR